MFGAGPCGRAECHSTREPARPLRATASLSSSAGTWARAARADCESVRSDAAHDSRRLWKPGTTRSAPCSAGVSCMRAGRGQVGTEAEEGRTIPAQQAGKATSK
eukprot:scaffold1604_cov127-Isochrysis_galbana.AAC.2